MSPPWALTIAGSDSGGGAGIQADLKTWTNLGVAGASAITAVTAQNTLGVARVRLLAPGLVRDQIAAALDGLPIRAVKLGMLGSAGIAAAVAEKLADCPLPAVVDPVLRASSGRALLDVAGLRLLRDRLCPLALVLTPNLPEASALLGRPIEREDQLARAADELLALGPRWVLLKGGHLAGEPVDLLCGAGQIHELRERRVPTAHTHGTGCAYAAAIAAGLAHGLEVPAAVRAARGYLQSAIERAEPSGRGVGSIQHVLPGAGDWAREAASASHPPPA
ncbi:MAG TPA: bifunctional hydroxymethylpyrimidine kinase/phosphomethylpyrimidine kinase [Herpetosiphonaceae bacterium]